MWSTANTLQLIFCDLSLSVSNQLSFPSSHSSQTPTKPAPYYYFVYIEFICKCTETLVVFSGAIDTLETLEYPDPIVIITRHNSTKLFIRAFLFLK